MERPGLQPGRWQAANGPDSLELLDLSHALSSGRPAALFLPGPFYLGVSGRTIRHDNPPSDGGLVAVVSHIHTAHLFKAAPDLFNVALEITRLSDNDTDTLAQAARVAVARALGRLS
jgi:hypothetical protein